MIKLPTDYTEPEIDALQAGRETDALVERDVMGATLTYVEPIPERSTDISAAWPVADSFDFYDVTKTVSGNYRANLRKRMGGKTTGYAHGCGESDSAPLAICKAALKAIRAMRLREISNG